MAYQDKLGRIQESHVDAGPYAALDAKRMA
jgi:hypothetical protein